MVLRIVDVFSDLMLVWFLPTRLPPLFLVMRASPVYDVSARCSDRCQYRVIPRFASDENSHGDAAHPSVSVHKLLP